MYGQRHPSRRPKSLKDIAKEIVLKLLFWATGLIATAAIVRFTFGDLLLTAVPSLPADVTAYAVAVWGVAYILMSLMAVGIGH